MSDETIFSVRAGDRVTLKTQVSICFPDLNNAKGVLAIDSEFLATATDRFQEIDGVKRRLFIETSIAFGGQNEIWMADSPAANETVADEWQEYFE